MESTDNAGGALEANKAVVRRWYAEIWNRWDLEVVDEIVAPELVFRGSLGTAVSGRDGLRRYMGQVRAAFPDFHNQIDALVAEGELVAARLTYSGTHAGELFGIAPTRRRIEYAGAAFFRLADRQVVEGWVLGDTARLRAQLSGDGPG
jgi:steroid delta-isomerase-like uncharacterized protein